MEGSGLTKDQKGWAPSGGGFINPEPVEEEEKR